MYNLPSVPQTPRGIVIDGAPNGGGGGVPVQPVPAGLQFGTFGNQAAGNTTDGFVALQAGAKSVVITYAAASLATGGGALTFELWRPIGGPVFTPGGIPLNQSAIPATAALAQGPDIGVLTGAGFTVYDQALAGGGVPVALPIVPTMQLVLAPGDGFVIDFLQGGLTYLFTLAWVELS